MKICQRSYARNYIDMHMPPWYLWLPRLLILFFLVSGLTAQETGSARPAFNNVFITDWRIDTLKKAILNRQEPAFSAFQDVQRIADENLHRPANVLPTWYVPGYYDDAEGHRRAKNGLRDDANIAYAQALCFRLTGKQVYAGAAIRIINAWATGIKTMSLEDDSMLSFSYHFPALIFAADLLRKGSVWPDDQQVLFSDFLRDHACHMSSIDRSNNWGNWGLVLSTACAVYLQDNGLFTTCIDRWKYFIENQIAADGHLPHEVNRGGGRSGIWYTHFCLMPQTIAAEILRNSGVDLFDYMSPSGRRLEQAFKKIAAWARAPEDFPYWKGDPKELGGVNYISYFEILNQHWPDKNATSLLNQFRPLSATHATPYLTFTHGESLE